MAVAGCLGGWVTGISTETTSFTRLTGKMVAGANVQGLADQVNWSIANVINFIKQNWKIVQHNALRCANWVAMQFRKEMCPVDRMFTPISSSFPFLIELIVILIYLFE